MEKEILVVHRWASFQKLRQFIRELKQDGREYKLEDRRDVHVFLLTAEGEGAVYKSRTFNVEIAKMWALEKHLGSRILFTKREGEWQYDQERVTKQWLAPSPNPLHMKTYRQQTYLVVTKKPLESAVIERWTDLSMKAKENHVGGRFDIVAVGANEEWDIFFNEDGLSDPGHLPNLKCIHEGEIYSVIVGPVFVLKVNEDGASRSLTRAEAQQAINVLNRMAVKPYELTHYQSALSEIR